MKKPTVIILFLLVTLMGTNAWWVYAAVNAGVSATYQEVTLRENREALDQALAVLLVTSKDTYTKEGILAAANYSYTNVEPFEKDGFIWVGRLGFSFSDAGRLLEVKRAWE